MANLSSQPITPCETAEGDRFFTTRLCCSIRNMSFSNVTQLTGQDTYDAWAITMEAIWRGQKLYELVVEGKKPKEDACREEQEAYSELSSIAVNIYILVVCPSILKKILKLQDPHLMWNSLSAEYHRTSKFTLVYQLGSLMSLSSTYDPNGTLSTFIDKYENEYFRVTSLSRESSSISRQKIADFLDDDEIKRDLILAFLSRHHKNIVDNLVTKDNLSYTEVKQRLLDIDHDIPSQPASSHSAYVTQFKKSADIPSKSIKPSRVSKSRRSKDLRLKECTFCRRHFPSEYRGHTWNSCARLAERKSIIDKSHNENQERANVTVTAVHKVSHHPFYLDTCATAHMCPYPERFEQLSVCSGDVMSSSNESMSIRGKGTVMLNCILSNGNISTFKIDDVLYVPKLSLPLFSWRKARSKGYLLYDNGEVMRICKNNKTWLEAYYDGALPVIRETTDINEVACSTYEFWHEALCHPAPSSMSKTNMLIQNSGIIPNPPKNFYCEACISSKSVHQKPSPSSSRAIIKGEYIHSDLAGPFPVPSYGNALYYISFIDDATRCATIRFLRYKSEAAQTTIDFISGLETQHDCRVKSLRTDNGGEYVGESLSRFLAQKGISHHLTPPYSPESNGVAERLNRSIAEGIRTMLSSIKDNRLWAEAAKTYIYTKNRSVHGSVNGQTPYEAFHEKKPSILHLHPFGRECYVHVPMAKRPLGSKLLPRAEKGVFVGYTEVDHQYRVFVSERKKIVISADVKFLPYRVDKSVSKTTSTLTPHVMNNPDSETPSLMSDSWPSSLNIGKAQDTRNIHQNQDPNHTVQSNLINSSSQEPSFSPAETQVEPQPTTTSSSQCNSFNETPVASVNSRPKRTIRTRAFEDTITGEWWKTLRDLPQTVSQNSLGGNGNELAMLNVSEESEPSSYSDVKASPKWEFWEKAIEEEMASLKDNDVWDVVPRPKGRKVVNGKWVFKIKRDAHGEVERYKARYVAKGFSQIQGLDYDETFAPVVRFDSLRILLAIAASKKWKTRQLDIKTAFLYGVLNEDIYMELPEGYRQGDHVAKLKRCIYGLKQSPREWFFRLAEYIIPCGFVSSLFDPCVFVHHTGKLIIAVYVDDIVIIGEQDELIDEIANHLKTEFKVKDMGTLHWLLGIQIDYSDVGITLSQNAYIDRILNRFAMHDCNTVSTPIECNQPLRAAQSGEPRANATLYQQIIGSLMYIVSATRPDLAFTISHLSQFNADPSVSHLSAAKRVLRYVKGTRDAKLLYKFESPLILNGYCDASYGNCLDTRRSFSGYLFQLGESTICWKSRKQRTVAHSTCEAEYMALSLATRQFLWVVRGLHQLVDKNVPTALSTDNKSAIDLAHNPKLNDATKHIDIAYHFTRERVEDKSLTLLHISSADNLADICTKGLPKPRLGHLCTSIFGTK